MEHRRGLPAVNSLIEQIQARDVAIPHAVAVSAARRAIERARRDIEAGADVPISDALVDEACAEAHARLQPSLRTVINATGVLLQTNLGRAPLSDNAIAAMAEVARGYTNLEFDVEGGGRGSRHQHLRGVLREVTGAEDAVVLNNNAAALFLALHAVAGNGEVIISRGQAVEIGGGVRIPEIAESSGASLVEVGTTNRTYAEDYRVAIGPETAAILRVHPSNFRISGFTAQPPLRELVMIAQEHGIPVIDDLGSGSLIDTTPFGIASEPTVQESIRAGADLVCFSGDKLLGGPQCGIIVGREEFIGRIRRHPLARAMRVDKLTIAALHSTLLSYLSGRAVEEIPLWRMLAIPPDSLLRRASRWARAAGSYGRVAQAVSMVGGGSLPGEGVPTWVATIDAAGGADNLARQLRAGDPPIIGRIENERVLLDPRTVDPRDDRVVTRALEQLASG